MVRNSQASRASLNYRHSRLQTLSSLQFGPTPSSRPPCPPRPATKVTLTSNHNGATTARRHLELSRKDSKVRHSRPIFNPENEAIVDKLGYVASAEKMSVNVSEILAPFLSQSAVNVSGSVPILNNLEWKYSLPYPCDRTAPRPIPNPGTNPPLYLPAGESRSVGPSYESDIT